MMAIGAVDAAAQRIWYAARWDWRNFWQTFELDPSEIVLFHKLPERYSETGAEPTCSLLPNPMSPMAYEELIYLNPLFGVIPFDQASAGLGLQAINLINWFKMDERHLGLPTHWGIQGSHLFLYPYTLPEHLAALNYGIDLSTGTLPITFNFYAKYVSLMDTDFENNSDVMVETPDNLSHILHHLALGYLQSDLEYPGAPASEGRGEKMLAKAVAEHRKLKRDTAQFRVTDNKRAW